MEFRDKYKNELRNTNKSGFTFELSDEFRRAMTEAEEWSRSQAKLPKQMRNFEDSQKSKKTVASMITRKGDEKEDKKKVKIVETIKSNELLNEEMNDDGYSPTGGLDEDTILANRRKLAEKLSGKKKTPDAKKQPKSTPDKSGKKPRVWDLGGNNRDLPNLDRSKDKPEDIKSDYTVDNEMIGTMVGFIKDLEVESEKEEDDDYSSSEDEEEEEKVVRKPLKGSQHTNGSSSIKKTSGVFSLFKGLVGSKNLSKEDMQNTLEKFREHLIAKNVASDIASKLCDSVAAKLEGRVLGTFETVAATVKTTLNDALVQILSPKRRVDILRDCLEAKKNRRPYVMAFCGVNGVGKSTNLAKICFWLIENNFSVLIAACDTFRAGAVEQLRTHTRHLNALHPPGKHGGRQMVDLYEKGYGKDAAGIAMEAIRFAKDSVTDVVLVDTAGRMQDNEPLMRALAKLIKVNDPDLVLFVGEALVGNEAVDQLVKFNQALADYSSNVNPHIIDGIVLTKFDTIDDKVGAAISMTYITGQPIVFVGTGQTYTDLKALNAKAVVQALMK